MRPAGRERLLSNATHGPAPRSPPSVSPLRSFLKNVDCFCISDNYWLGTSKPCITYGLRGITYFYLTVEGTKKDLHSGVFGGTVHEPMIDCVCPGVGGCGGGRKGEGERESGKVGNKHAEHTPTSHCFARSYAYRSSSLARSSTARATFSSTASTPLSRPSRTRRR